METISKESEKNFKRVSKADLSPGESKVDAEVVAVVVVVGRLQPSVSQTHHSMPLLVVH